MAGLRLIRFIGRLLREVGQDDLSGAATELAYKSFLAVFPFLIFLAALGGFVAQAAHVDNPTQEVMDLIGPSLPADASSVLRTQIDSLTESRSSTLLSVGILGAIWAASSAMGTVMKALNRVYEVKETRPLWKRYGIAVGLTALAGTFGVLALVMLFAGQLYGLQLADAIGIEGPTATLFTIARLPLAAIVLMLAVAFLFWAAPNVDLPFKWISPGATAFVIISLAATSLFGFYVANFGSYSSTYGTLGGGIVLLIWLYLTSLILLVAAEINSVLAQSTQPHELLQRAGSAATLATAKGGSRAESATEPRGLAIKLRQIDLARAVTFIVIGAVAVVGALRRGPPAGYGETSSSIPGPQRRASGYRETECAAK